MRECVRVDGDRGPFGAEQAHLATPRRSKPPHACTRYTNLLARPMYQRGLTHTRALFGSRRIQAYEIGGRRPPISATTYATAAEYAATSASAAATAPAAPASNNPGAVTTHATAAIYAKATAYALAIAIAALANDRPLPLLRHELLDALHGLDRGVGVAEGGQAHVALA